MVTHSMAIGTTEEQTSSLQFLNKRFRNHCFQSPGSFLLLPTTSDHMIENVFNAIFSQIGNVLIFTICLLLCIGQRLLSIREMYTFFYTLCNTKTWSRPPINLQTPKGLEARDLTSLFPH